MTGASPADVDLGLKYINRSLESFPENPKYLNMKALFLSGGLGRKNEAIALLEKARAINPRDITIESNLNALKSKECFVATAAYGTPFVQEIDTLRVWRKESLMTSAIGRKFNSMYNHIGPYLANFISKEPFARSLIRCAL